MALGADQEEQGRLRIWGGGRSYWSQLIRSACDSDSFAWWWGTWGDVIRLLFLHPPTLSAMSMSAASSIYMWHTPSAWPSTGMRVLCWMKLTSALPPLHHRVGDEEMKRTEERCTATCELERGVIISGT